MARPYYPVSRYTRRQYRNQATMLRLLGGAVIAGLVGLALLSSDLAHAAGPLLRFDGGIGSQPLRAGGASNTVVGTPPGGAPWVIQRLTADISIDGNIKVDGRGLLLGGTDNIGTPGGQRVRARLICFDPNPVAGQPAINVTTHDTALVALDANGDFAFNEALDPPLPATCNNPRLLIVNANGSWFAAGIPKR